MSPRKLLQRILRKPANIRFEDFVRLVRAFGFRLVRVNGSHHIFQRLGVPESLNVQNVKGDAKPYQIRQFLRIVERYNLKLQEE